MAFLPRPASGRRCNCATNSNSFINISGCRQNITAIYIKDFQPSLCSDPKHDTDERNITTMSVSTAEAFTKATNKDSKAGSWVLVSLEKKKLSLVGEGEGLCIMPRGKLLRCENDHET
eukprot:1361477-Amorphochlora_amoeboformis.AAC.1